MLFQAATIDWLNSALSKGLIGPHAEFIMMTPEIAQILLSKNDANRPIKIGIAAIIEDMKNGRWTFNGESVIVSVDGHINDGQHRLLSIVESGVSAPLTVIFGIPRSARYSVDQGRVRTVGDYLGMDGISNGSLVASIARTIIKYEAGDGTTFGANHSTSKGEIRERILSDELIQKSASFAASHSKHVTGMVTPTVIGTCHYLFSAIDADDAERFMLQVTSGEDLRQGDPAFSVRRAFVGLRTNSNLAMLEIMFRGWNAYRKRISLQVAKVMGQLPPLA